jgi:cbb3-type cytochrome oxidase subunit 3
VCAQGEVGVSVGTAVCALLLVGAGWFAFSRKRKDSKSPEASELYTEKGELDGTSISNTAVNMTGSEPGNTTNYMQEVSATAKKAPPTGIEIDSGPVAREAQMH